MAKKYRVTYDDGAFVDITADKYTTTEVAGQLVVIIGDAVVNFRLVRDIIPIQEA